MPNSTYNSIDDYITTFPVETQKVLQELRELIQKVAPNALEAISYQMPTFKLNGKNLVHFAAWKSHIGFYPTPWGTKEFEEELSSFKTAKGSIQFPLDQPMPFDLIKRIVEFRVSELTTK